MLISFGRTQEKAEMMMNILDKPEVLKIIFSNLFTFWQDEEEEKEDKILTSILNSRMMMIP